MLVFSPSKTNIRLASTRALPIRRYHFAIPKYASHFPLQRSFLASQKIQPVPGAMRFAHCVAQIAVQAGFAAELLPPKAVAYKAKATIAHVVDVGARIASARQQRDLLSKPHRRRSVDHISDRPSQCRGARRILLTGLSLPPANEIAAAFRASSGSHAILDVVGDLVANLCQVEQFQLWAGTLCLEWPRPSFTPFPEVAWG